jgi:molybdenum cofactor biosynthesis enzyme
VDNDFKKGDVLSVARIAGIMAAKQTHHLIPMCHSLNLSKISVDFEFKLQFAHFGYESKNDMFLDVL